MHGESCEVICNKCELSTPNDGGTYGSGMSVTSCDKLGGRKTKKQIGSNFRFRTYPNPFANAVNVSYRFEYDTDVKIEVYDITGSLIREAVNKDYKSGEEGITKIDLLSVDNKMYFVKISTTKTLNFKKYYLHSAVSNSLD